MMTVIIVIVMMTMMTSKIDFTVHEIMQAHIIISMENRLFCSLIYEHLSIVLLSQKMGATKKLSVSDY